VDNILLIVGHSTKSKLGETTFAHGAGFKDESGKFHPIQPKSHAGISASIGEKKPSSNLSKHLGSLKILAKKTHGAGKKAKAIHDDHQETKKLRKEALSTQIDEILYDDNTSELKKYQQIQHILSKEHKHLDKSDLKIYNTRLVELHARIQKNPEGSQKSLNHGKPNVQEHDPFEPSRRPSADDNIINRSHDFHMRQQQQHEEKQEQNKLSPEARAEVTFASL
jgi:hypothetical protein